MPQVLRRLRFLGVAVVLAGLGAGIMVAATPTAASAASRKLLASYQQDNPTAVVRAARPLAEKGNPEAQFILGLLLDLGGGVAIDHAAAKAWLEKAAAQQHDGARLMLAWRAKAGFAGEPVDAAAVIRWRAQAGPVADEEFAPWFTKVGGEFEPDFNRAFLWMLDAADEGDVAAMRNLTECYISKFWTLPDLSAHLRWLERASDAGNFEALVLLGTYYDAGILVTADAPKALALYQRAANGGFALAQFAMGTRYDQGLGVPKDIAAAISWYTKAAKQDHAPALIRLVELYRTGAPGLPLDFKKARRFAEQGSGLHISACTRHLADLYNRGDGVKRDIARSIPLYEEAAAGGDGPAMTMLGWIARTGQGGKPDSAAARRWFDRAADLNQVRAMWELAEMLERGQGAGPNPSAAFVYYERAARLGDAGAQDKLGRMLLAGQGMPADPDEAVNWFRLAARNTPATTLATPLRTWGHDAELAKGVDGLVSVARDENDPWLLDNLVAALSGDPLARPDLEPKIVRLLDEPDLLAVPGILPEACLAVLETNSTDPRIQLLAQAWFQKLLAADRLQSALLLGRHALDGRFMAPDAARALHWAKIAAAAPGWRGAVLLAAVEKQMATDPARGAQSLATLQKFAASGDPDAARFLATGHVLGPGDDAILKEARLAARIEQVVKARKDGGDYPPVALNRAVPVYPDALRKELVSGSVVVEFVINEEGRTQGFRIVRSSDRRFEFAAIAAVSQWRFAPGWKKGRAVNVLASQLLEFDAHDDDTQRKK